MIPLDEEHGTMMPWKKRLRTEVEEKGGGTRRLWEANFDTMIFSVEALLYHFQFARQHSKLLFGVVQIISFVGIFIAIIAVRCNISCLVPISSAFQLFATTGLFNARTSFTHNMTVKFLIITVAMRLTVVLCTGGYAPKDETGEWLFQSVEVVTLLLLSFYTYMSAIECHENRREWAQCLFIMMLCMLGGMRFKFHLIKVEILDAMWSASIMLETAVLIPQMYVILFRRTKSPTKIFPVRQNGQFVWMILLSRLASSLFWATVFIHMTSDQLVGGILLGCELSQLFLAIGVAVFDFYEMNHQGAAKEVFCSPLEWLEYTYFNVPEL